MKPSEEKRTESEARETLRKETETSGLQPHGDGSEMKPQETTPRPEDLGAQPKWPFPQRPGRGQ